MGFHKKEAQNRYVICGLILVGFIESYSKLIQRRPEKIIEHAVKGMLPKGALGRKIYTNLKVYKGEKHPHDAQTPELLNL